MSLDGFDLPDIFSEGRTPAPQGRRVKKSKKCKTPDCFERMERDSIEQAKGMGIDQPRKGSGIKTFNENIRRSRNPLNVGLQVGNLGIDTFDTKQSAFSGRVIDQGIGATPVPRSALGGASNLGADFISQTRGKEATGLQGGGEQDFLRVSGRSFASVPQILPSSSDQSPTVQGRKGRDRAEQRQQQGQPQGLDIVGGLSGLASGIGKAGTAVTLAERKQKKARARITQSQLATTLKQRASRDSADVNPFRLRQRKKVKRFVEDVLEEAANEEKIKQKRI